MPAKLNLTHTPTPIEHYPELDRLVDVEVWVKRDDMTAGAEAGNKIRKLEYLLAEARARSATTLITCGAAQSNHARATALVGRRLGMRSVLFLRATKDEDTQVTGNLLLARLSGAELRFITPEQYMQRDTLMLQCAQTLEAAGERPYVIPEGGSNGLGALGYVDAMAEVREQIDLGIAPARFDSVCFACGSGGTAAGVVLGIARSDLAPRAEAFAVCNSKSSFEHIINAIISEAMRLRPDLTPGARLDIHDQYQGPGYGVMDEAQRAFLEEVTRTCGLVLDPVYSGKALFGLSRLEEKPGRVLFIHTGGLPGLLAQAGQFERPASSDEASRKLTSVPGPE